LRADRAGLATLDFDGALADVSEVGGVEAGVVAGFPDGLGEVLPSHSFVFSVPPSQPTG
jgi:hypothetical protein